MRLDRNPASEEEPDSSRLAPLNPAHLTHEPVRRGWSWTRFFGGAVLGTLVAEIFRRLAGL
ncbi:hypothetical protein GCM10023165_42830 [Variovorax defluvii]|uniref:Uncharacterized protein n=1 Tax=Variovorax defluvii TaxID=913761 RepID=A0ABP8I807_9BURK